jgi:hypothetical protein
MEILYKDNGYKNKHYLCWMNVDFIDHSTAFGQAQGSG